MSTASSRFALVPGGYFQPGEERAEELQGKSNTHSGADPDHEETSVTGIISKVRCFLPRHPPPCISPAPPGESSILGASGVPFGSFGTAHHNNLVLLHPA